MGRDILYMGIHNLLLKLQSTLQPFHAFYNKIRQQTLLFGSSNTFYLFSLKTFLFIILVYVFIKKKIFIYYYSPILNGRFNDRYSRWLFHDPEAVAHWFRSAMAIPPPSHVCHTFPYHLPTTDFLSFLSPSSFFLFKY